MDGRAKRGMVVLLLAVGLVTGATAGVGVFCRGEGAVREVETERGERYAMVTDGVYRYNAERLVAEGVGWDIFTLLFAVPALLGALPLVARGSLRGRLFVLGLLAYLFYQYLMYAVSWAFGPLFVPFVVIYGASLLAFGWVVSTVGLGRLAERVGEGFPRRGVAVLCFVMAALLVLMWSARLAAAYRGEAAGALIGQTTHVIPALDLGLVVPLSVVTGALVWRRRPLGYLMSAVFVVKALAMAAAICAMLLSAWVVEGALEVGPFAIFAAAAGASGWLAVRMFRSVRPAATGA